MKYALNLDENNRILSATYEKYAGPNQPIVDELPEDNIIDYFYINGEYIYDPIPELEPDPTSDDILNVLLGVGE